MDPENGSDDGDGSAENPWRTLQRVIEDGKIEFYAYSEAYNTDSALETVPPGAPVRGGDTLILKSGYHGHVSLHSFIFSDWLTIRADDGATPVLSQFKLEGAFRNIYLRGLTVAEGQLNPKNPGENYWESEAVTYNTDACLYLGSSDFYGDGRS